jgi:hypothetical protein
MNFGAHSISPEAEETCPADSASHIEEEKTRCRQATGARKQSRKHSQHRYETPKKHDGAPVPKKKISTDQQSILIEPDVATVSVKKGQTKPPPDHVSGAVPDNRTRCSGQHDDDDVDLAGGGGKECSGNKDCLTGKRHAGAFERNDTKDDPRAVDRNQADQSVGQRGKLTVRLRQTAIAAIMRATQPWFPQGLSRQGPSDRPRMANWKIAPASASASISQGTLKRKQRPRRR